MSVIVNILSQPLKVQAANHERSSITPLLVQQDGFISAGNNGQL